MTDEQKNEWLEEQGADTNETLALFIREVA